MNFRVTVILQIFLSILTFSADNYGWCIASGQGSPYSDVLQLQASTENQSLVVRWLSNQSHSWEQKEQFELQISSPVGVYNVSEHRVGGDGVHTLEWQSPLPLECADHSVRIRRFHGDPSSSSWSQWTTHHGLQLEPAQTTRQFPTDRVMLEGSRPWLCCIPPPGASITEMHFNKHKYNMVSLGDSVQAIQAYSLNISTRIIKRVQFKCMDSRRKLTFTLITPSIPPEEPRNFSCETPDLKKVLCRWDPGRDDHLSMFKQRMQTLYINNQYPGTTGAPYAVECEMSSCEFPVTAGVEEYAVELLVSNPLGEQSARYSFNISDRVFPVVELRSVRPGVKEANVSWTTKDPQALPDLLCHVGLIHRGQEAQACGRKDGGLCQATVSGLLPNTRYSARVRCGLQDKSPGGWSKRMAFSTDPSVTLDLWRTINPLPNNSRGVTLFWKQHVPGTACTVVVQGYKIKRSQDGEVFTTRADTGQSQAEIPIGPGRCEVTVQADLPVGSSDPASITIPAVAAGEPVVEQRVDFRPNLSWTGQHWCQCGYAVEWCIVGSIPCALTWMKLPPGNTSLLLEPADYKDGVRYTFNIYGCTENGHKLLEIQTGYFRELRPVARPRLTDSVARATSVTLEWHYDEEDPAHPGTITGYLVRVQEAHAQGSPSQTPGPRDVPVTDPRRKRLTLWGLQQDTAYQFTLSAVTKEGSGPEVTTTIRTGSDHLVYWAKILTPLVLLLVCSVLLGHRRKTLESCWKETFAFPDGMRIKAFELEMFLEETSKRLDTKQLDECICCDIEIINTKLPPK